MYFFFLFIFFCLLAAAPSYKIKALCFSSPFDFGEWLPTFMTHKLLKTSDASTAHQVLVIVWDLFFATHGTSCEKGLHRERGVRTRAPCRPAHDPAVVLARHQSSHLLVRQGAGDTERERELRKQTSFLFRDLEKGGEEKGPSSGANRAV